MTTVLAALSERVDLTVLFCAAAGTRSGEWSLDARPPFRGSVVGGLTIRRRSPDATDYYPSPRILAGIARSRPDVVFSGAFSFPSLYAAAYASLARRGLVIYSDGTSLTERDLNPLQRLSRSIVMRSRPFFAANSEPAAQRFLELGAAPERVFRAPHSTNLEPLWAVARERIPAARDAVRVLGVGRLIPRKGFDLLIDAVARARREEPALELTLVGSGPEEGRLRERAAARGLDVRFEGFVDQPSLPAAYADADVFAFPSTVDEFGIVLLEAAASGLALVASPYAGATLDLVEDGRHGYVVDPRDVDAMASRLVRLARDPELRAGMGRAAHEATLARTPAASAAGYVAAGEAAIASARR